MWAKVKETLSNIFLGICLGLYMLIIICGLSGMMQMAFELTQTEKEFKALDKELTVLQEKLKKIEQEISISD